MENSYFKLKSGIFTSIKNKKKIFKLSSLTTIMENDTFNPTMENDTMESVTMGKDVVPIILSSHSSK